MPNRAVVAGLHRNDRARRVFSQRWSKFYAEDMVAQENNSASARRPRPRSKANEEAALKRMHFVTNKSRLLRGGR